MPEFIPEHTPGCLDDFTTGYLECAEWLAHDSSDTGEDFKVRGATIRGFTRAAVRNATRDCAEFQRDNAAALAEASTQDGYSEARAGHDFYLTRNGHGAGFWDRGLGKVGRTLTDAAHSYGSADCEFYRGWLHLT